jgi:hypothetical protein
MDDQHQMILRASLSSGEEDWICPKCGRHVLITWSPSFKKIILDVGDEMAVHTGSKGGVIMQISKLISNEELDANTDPRLSVWSDWMKKIHLDDWWDNDD